MDRVWAWWTRKMVNNGEKDRARWETLMRSQLQKIAHREGTSVGIPCFFEDPMGVYRAEFLEMIHVSSGEIRLRVYYVIRRTFGIQYCIEQSFPSDDNTMSTENEGVVSRMTGWLVRVFRTGTVCPDCTRIIPEPVGGCDRCLLTRVVAGETGSAPPECPVCLEPIRAGTAFLCGHMVHRLCMIRMNPCDTIESLSVLPRSCPLCRQPLSGEDLVRIFGIPYKEL